ncbi:MAG: LytR C-terminal domain-containing protein, partial [Actinomycetota bacterium]
MEVLNMSQQRPRGSRPAMAMPNTGTMGAVVAVSALILGVLILRDVRNDGGSTVTPGGDTNTTAPTGNSVDPAASTTTAPAYNRGAFKIQVANASSIAGSAGDLTTKLQDQNFVVQPPLNVAPNTPKREKTGVFYL